MNTSKSSSFMEKIATFIVDKRKAFYLIFIVSMFFCIYSMNKVKVNTNISSYLPDSTETRRGLNIMDEEFTTYGSVKIMIENITYEKAEILCEQIEQMEGVSTVDFDDEPAHYSKGAALFDITLDGVAEDEISLAAVEKLREIVADYDATVYTEVGYDESKALDEDMALILVLAAIVILIVLVFTSKTYAEIPVFCIVFIVAALLNMGTNYWLGEISFITKSIAVVLQLALAIDYAIILSHRFMEEHEVLPVREAVIQALSKAIPEIFSSSLTTISGLMALMLMQLKIGMDMGLVLSKGIVCSLVTVFLLMPGLLVMFSKAIDKTHHRNFVPKITFWGKGVVKTRFILPVVFAFILVFAIIFSNQCDYVFDVNSISGNKATEQMEYRDRISRIFGQDNVVAVVVKKGDYESEKKLLYQIEEIPEVKSAVGLANTEVSDEYMLTDKLTTRQFSELLDIDIEVVRLLYQTYGLKNEEYQAFFGEVDEYAVPILDMVRYLGEMQKQGVLVSIDQKMQDELEETVERIDQGVDQLMGEEYTRLVVTLDTAIEGDQVERITGEIRECAKQYYKDVLLVGNTTSAMDLSASFEKDNLLISILTILFVAVILLFTFKSAGIPVLLILTIQGSIWINFSFPFITNGNMYFLSYLIINAIQMGATIDYAIVITNRYQELKNEYSLTDAIIETLNQSFPTILTSGSILTISGFLINGISSDPTIASIGLTLGRGSLISIILVMTVLPQILLLGNILIEKTAFTLNRDRMKRYNNGLVSVDGHIRGYVSGVVDADVKGFIRGDLAALVDTKTKLDYEHDEELEQEKPDRSDTKKELQKIRHAEEKMKNSATMLLVLIISLAAIFHTSVLTAYADEAGETSETVEVSAPTTQITIGSTSEWNMIAKQCQNDTYSLGKTFVLIDNLYFEDDFEPFPYMNGNFDGGGYSISGIHITGMNSDTAIFRYVSETGCIENLNVEAIITADGTAKNIGGVVSHNEGLIQDVHFSGKVTGKESIGGVVAINEETGVINSCVNEAQILGDKYTGGICGNNYGYILKCSNEGGINDNSTNSSFQSAGGITGFNHGMICESVNNGIIGYHHIGYNVGGIAGMQDGKINDCTNYGIIYGRKDCGGIVGQFTPYTTVAFEELYSLTIANSMNNITGLSNQLATEMTSFESMTSEAMIGAGEDLVSSTYDTMSSTEDYTDFKNNLDSISSQMDQKRENRGNYSTEAQKSMDRIVSLTKQIDREMSVVNSAAQAIENKSEEDVIVDISASDSAEDTKGYLFQCTNYGEVFADSNVGGIVGTMDFDNTNDPEEDVTQIGDLSLNLHATIQLVTSNCKNVGMVTSVNDNAGGIVGFANHGYIDQCKNTGDVCSEKGGYVAGIAAYSKIAINQCCAHCIISGESFVGGIAAHAYSISNCASIVNILECEEKAGAIAAVVEEDFSNNYFISDSLGGIDGISFAGRAEELGYDEMNKLLELDPDFYSLQVVFVSDGRLVDSVEIRYGGTIEDSQIPEVPMRDEETYGGWEYFEKNGIETNIVVHAKYDKWITTIETREEIPLFLYEGHFYPNTDLIVTELSPETYSVRKWDTIAHYEVKCMNNSLPMQDHNAGHLLWEKKDSEDLQVMIVHTDGSVEKVPHEWSGKYLVFDMTDANEFYIMTKRGNVKKIVLTLVGISVFVLIFLPFSVGISTKRKIKEEERKIRNKRGEK